MEFRESFGFEPSSNWLGRILTGWRVRQRLYDLWIEATAEIKFLEEKRGKTGQRTATNEYQSRYAEAARLAQKAGYKVKEEPLMISKEKKKA